MSQAQSDEKAETRICLNDDAARCLAPNSRPIDPITDRHLLRKADLHILPLLCLFVAVRDTDHTVNDTDTNLFIKIGLRIHLVNSDKYSLLAWFSFLLVSLLYHLSAHYYPQALPAAKIAAFSMFFWGIVLMASAGCTSYKPYIVTRILMSALGGLITPALTKLACQWYKDKELLIRFCSLYAALYSSTLIKFLIPNIPVYSMLNPYLLLLLSKWRETNLILGLITIFLSMIFLWRVPDFSVEARWLNEDEKCHLVERSLL